MVIGEENLRLAELLCARLCHDMAGPVGAAAAGAELLEDMAASADAETLALVAQSAAGAAARLKFFRSAFGPAASAPQSSAGLADLIRAYFATQVSAASPGLTVDWRVEEAALDGATARLVLNLMLLAKDALPRGGQMTATAGPDRLSVIARGEPAALTDEAREVLVECGPPSGPRGAQAAFTRALAGEWGGNVAATATADGLDVAVMRGYPVG